jgi:hypothetical protein
MAGGNKFEGKQVIVFNELEGMSTQSERQDLPEKKAAWMENLQPIAPNNLVCTPAMAAALASLASQSETIAKMYYFNFGQSTDYIVCFCQSGAGYTVANPGGAIVKFANAGTFSTTPDVTQWGTQRLLIADSQSGYYTYDATVAVGAGGISPNITVTAGGSGYGSGATAASSGGSGSGDTYSVQVTGGIVTGVTLLTPGSGFLPTDTITLTITAVSGGSGATANAHVWPTFGINATTIAVFGGRVWLGAGNVITYSGTGASYGGIGYDDFNPADASGTTTIQDADLVHRITALRSLNNYLFIFGDASVKQIGNISVSGSTTNFTITTLSSDQGTIYRDSIVSYNRLVIFANTVGVFAVFGSSVEKISDDMDGIFRLIDFTQNPCAAVNDINNIHCYLLLVRYKDPNATTRSLILAFMNKRWFVISQGSSLLYIVNGIINSVYNTFGTSGADITPLLKDSTTAVSIKLITSLTSHGEPMMGKRAVRYAIAQTVGASSTMALKIESERAISQTINYNISNVLNFVNNSVGALQFVNQGGGNLNFITNAAGFHYQHGNTGGIGGVYLGMTLTGSVANFTLSSMMLEFGEGAPFGTDQVAYAATL